MLVVFWSTTQGTHVMHCSQWSLLMFTTCDGSSSEHGNIHVQCPRHMSLDALCRVILSTHVWNYSCYGNWIRILLLSSFSMNELFLWASAVKSIFDPSGFQFHHFCRSASCWLIHVHVLITDLFGGTPPVLFTQACRAKGMSRHPFNQICHDKHVLWFKMQIQSVIQCNTSPNIITLK